MIYAKIPAVGGIPLTKSRIINAIGLSDAIVVACVDTDTAEEDWEVITEEEWNAFQPVEVKKQTLEEQVAIAQKDNLAILIGMSDLYELLLSIKNGGTV